MKTFVITMLVVYALSFLINLSMLVSIEDKKLRRTKAIETVVAGAFTIWALTLVW